MSGRSVFEAESDRYEAWFQDHAFAYESELQAIRELLPGIGKGLEIGVGSGLFAAPLGITQGIDPSSAMLHKARQRGIDVIQGVAENLPYKDAEFDFALMVTTVCFLDDLELAFREAFRVLKPQGSFLIGFVDKNSPIGKSYEERKQESLFYRDATFYAVDELLLYLTSTGFEKFSFRQTLFCPVSNMRERAPIKDGYGEGSFLVIKAEKK
jgi:ubiquinone/menaquinone biosynthesis C-methylase UbiE